VGELVGVLWRRCRLISTNQDVPEYYLTACRGFGAVQAMFKIYDRAEGRSGMGRAPVYILRISGNIDDAFQTTDRSYSWGVRVNRLVSTGGVLFWVFEAANCHPQVVFG
jgi:hypothetical protein